MAQTRHHSPDNNVTKMRAYNLPAIWLLGSVLNHAQASDDCREIRKMGPGKVDLTMAEPIDTPGKYCLAGNIESPRRYSTEGGTLRQRSTCAGHHDSECRRRLSGSFHHREHQRHERYSAVPARCTKPPCSACIDTQRDNRSACQRRDSLRVFPGQPAIGFPDHVSRQ